MPLPVRRALLSVSDKAGIIELAHAVKHFDDWVSEAAAAA